MNTNYKTEEIIIEICNHCGKDVSWDSGRFVNRIPDLNNIQTRFENNLFFPLGDFICSECDQKSENEYL